MRSGSRFKPIRVRPADGGQLLTNAISTEMVGLHNYTIKQDWRRDQQDEIRREGFDLFHPNLAIPIGTQPFPEIQNLSGTTTAHGATTITGVGTAFLVELEVGDRIALSSSPGAYISVLAIESNVSLTVNTGIGDGSAQGIIVKRTEPITLLHMARQPNGRTAQIAGTPTTLYRYQALEDGKYFEDFDNPGYFEDPVLGPNLAAGMVYGADGYATLNLDPNTIYSLKFGANELQFPFQQPNESPYQAFIRGASPFSLFGVALASVTAQVQAVTNQGEPYFDPTNGLATVTPTSAFSFTISVKFMGLWFFQKVQPCLTTVLFVDDGSVEGNAAAASFDLSLNTLTVKIDDGETTCQKVEDAIRSGAPGFLNRGTSAGGPTGPSSNSLAAWYALDEASGVARVDSSGNANALTDVNGVAQVAGKIDHAADFSGNATPLQEIFNSTLDNGLAAYWKLDNGSMLDSSPNGNTLTNSGSAASIAGKIATASGLNGTSQSLEIANNASLQLNPTDSWTVALWVYLNANTANQTIFGKYKGNFTAVNFGLGTIAGSLLRFTRTNSSGVGEGVSIALPSAGAWFLAICKYDHASNLFTIKINNSSTVSSGGGNNATVTDGMMFFGGLHTFVAGAPYMAGGVDEIGYWKRALTSGEETGLWNAGNGKTPQIPAVRKTLEIANNASLQLAASDSFTVIAWCYITSSSDQILLAKYNAAGSRSNFTLKYSSGYLRFLRDGASTIGLEVIGNAGGLLALSAWHLIVIKFDLAGSLMTLKIDDQFVNTRNTSENNATIADGKLSAGGSQLVNLNYFSGRLDEVAFFKRATSDVEDAQFWNKGNGVGFSALAGGGGSGVISLQLGLVTFTTQAALGFLIGTQAVIRSASSPWLWMKGQITSYSGTTLVVNVTEIAKVAGSTQAIDWTINAENASGFDVQGSDYFVPTDVGTSYFERTGVGEPYFDLGIGVWRIIGRGFNPNASRWEAVNLNGWTVINNGKNLPVSYRVEDEVAVPIHELRENGVAYVGTIAEFNGILLGADVGLIKEDSLPGIFKHVSSGSITASQTGATTSGLVTATQVGATSQILSSSAFFAAGNVGKTIQFSNGFKSVILSFQDTTHITLTNAPTVVGATPTTFYIIDLAASYLIVASAPYFTAGMVGRSLYFPSGVTRLVTSFVDASTVRTDSFLPVASSTFLLENVTAYGEVYDSLVERIQYRMLWGMPGLPRRFAAVASGSMISGSYILELDYPIKSFSIGQQITVVGAGLPGNTLTATIIWIAPNRTTLSLSGIADTDVTSALVQASDASGSIVGFEDLQDDGSAIIRMLPLKNLLVIYKDTSIFLASYTGLVSAPFNFGQQGPVYRGEASIAYRNTLVKMGDQVHLYAGRNSFWTFDLISRVPKLYTLGNQLRNLFFSRATLAQTNLIFAADNAITKEVMFFFPDTAHLTTLGITPPPVPVDPPVTPFPPVIVLGEAGVVLGEDGFGLV